MYICFYFKSYISCVNGVNYVGLVIICCGVSDALGSYLFGYVIEKFGRIPCFVLAALMNYATITVMVNKVFNYF